MGPEVFSFWVGRRERPGLIGVSTGNGNAMWYLGGSKLLEFGHCTTAPLHRCTDSTAGPARLLLAPAHSCSRAHHLSGHGTTRMSLD